MARTRVFRTTVSLPLDLYETMKSHCGEVNWSAVACVAFAKALRNLEGGRPVLAEEPRPSVEERLEALESAVFGRPPLASRQKDK